MARKVGFYLMGRCVVCKAPYPTTTWAGDLFSDNIKFCYSCGCRINQKLEEKAICKNCEYRDQESEICTSEESGFQVTDDDDTCEGWTKKIKR